MMNVSRGRGTLVLKPGREKALNRRHPWLFSGAVASVKGDPPLGDTVAVRADNGSFLAHAAYSPKSQIVARIWSFSESDVIDPSFFEAKLKAAIDRRGFIQRSGVSNAIRLVHAESDGVPGLIVDRYADMLVAQFLSAGVERWREEIT